MEQKKFEFNENVYDNTVNMDMNMNSSTSSCCSMDPCMSQNMMCPPVHECPQERVCHRYICYEVPQD